MGKLFYVIGASGAGKDSVMEYARKNINGKMPVLFAHRYITRQADAGGENHLALTENEFNAMRTGNLFVYHWESHGKQYGIGIEVKAWIEHGFDVVVNGSREYLPEAKKLMNNIEVILISAKPETIKVRLKKRGRENDEEIEKRLKRNKDFQIKLKEINQVFNDGKLEEAGQQFLKILSDSSQLGAT